MRATVVMPLVDNHLFIIYEFTVKQNAITNIKQGIGLHKSKHQGRTLDAFITKQP